MGGNPENVRADEIRSLLSYVTPTAKDAALGKTTLYFDGEEVGSEGFQFECESEIFTDGSAYFNQLKEVAVASAAAVQQTKEGPWRVAVYVLAAEEPATAVTAEHAAIVLAAQFAIQGAEVVTDCQAVLQGFEKRYDMGYKDIHAGYWKQVVALGTTEKLSKVKARQDLKVLVYGTEKPWAVGNDRAYMSAKMAAHSAIDVKSADAYVEGQRKKAKSFVQLPKYWQLNRFQKSGGSGKTRRESDKGSRSVCRHTSSMPLDGKAVCQK
jgi:ribonuclease HI